MEALVDEIEEELNDINTSGEFSLYSDFIKRYSDTYLHRNHYLLMTAARYVKIKEKVLCICIHFSLLDNAPNYLLSKRETINFEAMNDNDIFFYFFQEFNSMVHLQKW